LYQLLPAFPAANSHTLFELSTFHRLHRCLPRESPLSALSPNLVRLIDVGLTEAVIKMSLSESLGSDTQLKSASSWAEYNCIEPSAIIFARDVFIISTCLFRIIIALWRIENIKLYCCRSSLCTIMHIEFTIQIFNMVRHSIRWYI
jgi:hypothetical protein